jgi:hypothetical protein
VAFASQAGVFVSEIDLESCAILIDGGNLDVSGCITVVDTDFPAFTTRDWDTVILDGIDVVYQVVGEGIYFASGSAPPGPVVEIGVTPIPGSSEVFTDVGAFFLHEGRVVFEGTGTFACGSEPAFVDGGVFVWSAGSVETVAAPCDRVGDERVESAFFQRTTLPISPESMAGQRIVLEATVSKPAAGGVTATRTTTFLAEGLPVVEAYAHPEQIDEVGVVVPETGETALRVLDEAGEPAAFAYGEKEFLELLVGGSGRRKVVTKMSQAEFTEGFYNYFITHGVDGRFLLTLIKEAQGDFDPGSAPARTSAALVNEFAPVGGPFGRFFATPRDLRGRSIRARVSKEPGAGPTAVRIVVFRDQGRQGAWSEPFDLLEAPHEVEASTAELTPIEVPGEPAVPFDMRSVEGIALAFRADVDEVGLDGVQLEIEQLVLTPEPSAALAGWVALVALGIGARRSHARAGSRSCS